MNVPAARAALAAVAVFLSAEGGGAEDVPPPPPAVELAPFAGVQFPGSVISTVHGHRVSMGIGLDYGATLDVAVAEGWRVELLFSRQATDLPTPVAGERFGLAIERYMAGIEEEKGDERLRFFGVFLLGATRFAPGRSGGHSDVAFTLGLSLGLKRALSRRLALRAEARGFFVSVASASGLACNGPCLFSFHAYGLWQGDLAAGVTLGF